MRRIALIMDGWKRFFTYAWPSGVLQRISETDEEINLYIFNSSGDWSRDEEYNVGEYNIYHLPDFNDFDGIIIDINNIHFPDACDYVIASARKTGKPVISIANDIEDFYYVGINNYGAMQEVIAHLNGVHDCRSFWFVMGPEDNYENRQRAQALRDYMDAHALAWEENDFYFESYEYKGGVNGFKKLMETHGSLPDAIICANDNIAVGVCEEAAKYGYRAPDDFLLTGFDDFDKASYYSPHITTVSHIREEVGYVSADILIRLWRGEEVPHFNYTGHRCIFWESCGCEADVEVDEAKHASEQIIYGIETDEFEEQVLSLEYELMRCKSVREMTRWIPKCIPAMRCDAMYLIIDEHMNDFRLLKDYYDRHMIENEEFCVHGYPEEMRVEFAYENGAILEQEDKMIKGLFPMFDTAEGGKDFLFLPLHFRDRTVGYFAIRNAVYLMEKQYLFQVVNALTSAMENLHKKEKLGYLNNVLSDLYVKDAMTGMYNRLGYQKFACGMFEDRKRSKEDFSIIFIDMDRLKYINDHYGHIHGDWAIKTIAGTILKHIPESAIAVRTGGDEFLVVLGKMEEDQIDAMVTEIRREIRERSAEMQLPFPLTISAGWIHTDMTTDRTLDDYVREADEIMYQEKMAKHVNRR